MVSMRDGRNLATQWTVVGGTNVLYVVFHTRPARVFDVHDGVGSSDGGVCAGLRASAERFHEGFVTVNASARS